MNLYDLLQMVGQSAWIYVGSFLVVLSVLVFVHEWGHYIIARMNGVRVETFSIGFGREIFGFYDKAGTRWKFSLIPLGGYVQMFGDTDPASAGQTSDVEGADGATRPMTEEELNEAFFTKKIWQRAAIVFAGPAINYIFAIFLLTCLYVSQGQPVTPPTAAGVIGGSSADAAGFQPHDVIVSVDGKSVDDFKDVQREVAVALDLERHFVVRRGSELVDIHVRPKRIEFEDRFGFKSTKGFLGLISAEQGIAVSNIEAVDGVEYEAPEDVLFALQQRMGRVFKITMKGDGEYKELLVHPLSERNKEFGEGDINEQALYLSHLPSKLFTHHTVMTGLQSALWESYVMTRSTLEALWQMVVGVRSATELGGIVRIGAIAGDMAQQGFVQLVLLTALLSINLGFINLLPIPMLDGGHLTFYAAEAVLGRPVPDAVQEYAFRVGFIFLIGVMAFANLNDLYQLLM